MGKYDYQKSYARQIESIVIVICAFYSFTQLFLGYKNDWNLVGQMVVLCGMLISWIYFFGQYQTYEVRAYVTSIMSQLTVFMYAVEVGDFYSVISVYLSLCIALGLYGIPKVMTIPLISYTGIILHCIFIDKSLAWGHYDSDLGMVMRVLQGYLVWFVVFYLVYRYKTTQESMLEMIDALKKSERQKDDFLANVSHEIRTPINTICGISEIMLRDGVPQEMKEDILNIQSAGRNLMMVVSDILDYSELQEGEFDIVEENYYVSSTIYDVINMTMAKKSEKKLELIINCDANIPSVLIGDEQKIRRVIMNLVNNAIEFTEEGCVCIEFGYRKEEYGVNLIVTVKDTGIGMSKEDIEKLFVKFSQVDMGRTRKKGGVGLGLAIAQAIIYKMGGFITVKSELGKGSEFRFVIPQKVFDEKPIAEIPNKEEINAAVYINMEQFEYTALRDEYSNNIRQITEQAGVKVRVFRNLMELKRWSKRERYNQIFISLKEYQEDSVFFDNLSMQAKVNVILDNCDEAKVQNRLINKIIKPFFVLSIMTALKNQNRDEKEEGRILDDAHQLYAPDARVLVIDDNQMNIRVVEGLLKEYGLKVDSALSGPEGIAMLENRSYDMVFLDHMMPEMDGVETLHHIRRKQDSYFKEIPIVALTANAIAGTREMLIKEGFDDFLPKPVESSVLQRALKRHIPIKKQKTMEEYVQNEPIEEVEAKPVAVKSMPETKVKPATTTSSELQIGDLEISKGIMYCGNQKNYIEILKTHRDSGEENMSACQALFDKEDWKNYTITVHGIKSSMMSIGAVKLSEMAKALEMAGKGEDYTYIRANHEPMMDEYRRIIDILNHSDVLGAPKAAEAVCEKTEIEESVFANMLTEMENASYELDDAKMKGILDQLSAYSYGSKDLAKELQTVYKKVEMSDLMSAYETVVKLKDKMKKA